jgi:hypothetical protein
VGLGLEPSDETTVMAGRLVFSGGVAVCRGAVVGPAVLVSCPAVVADCPAAKFVAEAEALSLPVFSAKLLEYGDVSAAA